MSPTNRTDDPVLERALRLLARHPRNAGLLPGDPKEIEGVTPMGNTYMRPSALKSLSGVSLKGRASIA